MADDPLSDEDVHARLVAAREALGEETGATPYATTTLIAARQALTMFQMALVTAMERASNDLTDSDASPPE